MQSVLSTKTIGACVIGFALVIGALTLRDFSVPSVTQQQSASTITPVSTPRAAIAVVDTDQNGIEDWRDEFVETEPIILDPIDSTYTPPDTLTGQLGVNFIESYVRSKTYGSFGRSTDELVADTVDILATETAHQLFDVPDITIMSAWEDSDIHTYANTMALSILNNDVDVQEGELFILFDILERDASERLSELEALASAYQSMRDEALAIPVPGFLAKEHLDIINTYHAIHKDIEAMTIAVEDPAFTLMRLKRYEDDATGLGIAMTNLYNAITPYARLFSPEDPALLLIGLSTNATI